MSTLFFDPATARSLVHRVRISSASVGSATTSATSTDDFSRALRAALNRLSARHDHLSQYLSRVADNSEQIISMVEQHDSELGHRFGGLS